MVLAILGNSIQNIALAQSNSNSNSNSNETSGNQTRAEITGKPETTILNKTTVPFEQTTVEGVNQTQEQGQQQGNQTGTQQQDNKSSGPLEKIGETITGAFN